MKIYKRQPKDGRVFDWDIAEILTRTSADVKNYDHNDIGLEWETTLFWKRKDDNYADIEESIKRYGFLRPCTAYISDEDDLLHFGDGHHRLAVAIDLGMTTVPVKVYAGGYPAIADDSGEWNLSEDGIDNVANLWVD